MKLIPQLPEPVKLKLILAARIFIGVVFVYSGGSKLVQPAEYFEIAIAQYQIVPETTRHMVALIMPWIEYIGGAFLIIGYALEASSALLAILTAAFQFILGQAVIRKLPIDECGCFGGGFIHLTLYQSFVLDTVMVLLLIQVATADRNLATLDAVLRKERRT